MDFNFTDEQAMLRDSVARYFGDMTAHAQGRISLNPVRHIDILGTIVVPLVMVVGPRVSARSVREFILLAKENPGKLTYASAGIGTITIETLYDAKAHFAR